MRLARVLGAIGRALISAGVIVLLFVAYQLWGTGFQHSQAQGDLENDFLALLDSETVTEAQTLTPTSAEREADDEEASEETAEDVDDESTDDAAATDDDEPETEAVETPVEYSPEFLAVLYPEEGASLARIVIPAINVDQIVVEGVSVEDLRKGPGHYPSTPNPGQAGNASIAGHRTTYGAPFHRIDELNPGDEIIVTTIQGQFTYLVRDNQAPDGTTKGHFIVSPSDTWVLGQESGENLLTLTACHPKYSARQRIIVQAELVGEPAATPPREGGDELAPVELDAGAEDEAPGELTDERATDSDDEAGDDVGQVMSDEVAADDDPSVDADGTPIDDDESTDEPADRDEATETDDAEVADETELEDAAAEQIEEFESDEVELTAGQTPFSSGEDDFGEGLNGDRTKIRPAIMWGLAGGSIWLAAWFIGRRLDRKWTLYLIGLVAFTPALWSCFVNIDQALPSY